MLWIKKNCSSCVQQHVVPALHHPHSAAVCWWCLCSVFQPCLTACRSCPPPPSQCCCLLMMFVFCVPAVSNSMSFLLSTTLTVLLFAGMQLYQTQLASKEWMTILGGFLGSILFIFIITVSFTGQTSPLGGAPSNDMRVVIPSVCQIFYHQ